MTVGTDNQHKVDPTIVVLDLPTLKRGPLGMRCEACNRNCSITSSTVVSIHQMKKAGKYYLVICFSCFQVLRQRVPGLLGEDKTPIGSRQARAALGLNT